jgi:hypothetical protein
LPIIVDQHEVGYSFLFSSFFLFFITRTCTCGEVATTKSR